MFKRLPSHANRSSGQTLYGLRIASGALQLAIAKPDPDAEGCFDVSFDQIEAPSSDNWLSDDENGSLRTAIAGLAARHNMRDQQIAVSLDGDYCVTRIFVGSPEQIDLHLEEVDQQVQRYLQLGPGRKAIGTAQMGIGEDTHYAIVAVAQERLINQIYEAFLEEDIDASWIEPSLASVSRLPALTRSKEEFVLPSNYADSISYIAEGIENQTDGADLVTDGPVLIADGLGSLWDVGIADEGRLMLNYRPASAATQDGFVDALMSHRIRLQRFCFRHRKLTGGPMQHVMIVADEERAKATLEELRERMSETPEDSDAPIWNVSRLKIPQMRRLYRISQEVNESSGSYVGSFAALLPLMLLQSQDQATETSSQSDGADASSLCIVDLLDSIRRAPSHTLGRQLVQTAWPAMVAAALLLIGSAFIQWNLRLKEKYVDRQQMQVQVEKTRLMRSRLQNREDWLQHVADIRQLTKQNQPRVMLDRVTASMPPQIRLKSFTWESTEHLTLSGSAVNEEDIFSFLPTLRQIPGITGVALRGTNPVQDLSAVEFAVQLKLQSVPIREVENVFDNFVHQRAAEAIFANQDANREAMR